MGLRKDAASAPAAEATAKPEFETEGAANTQAPVAEQPAPEVVPAGAPDPVQASTAVATRPATGVAVATGTKYAPALNEFKDQIDPATLDFDTFPRITVGLDGFSEDKKTELGKKIAIELMSWNERYIVTTGKDDDEANALVRYSLDGVHIDGTGELCSEYVKQLKEVEGYEDAAIKKYYQIYGFLVAKSPEGNLEVIDAADRPIISIQIPPRSVSQFTRFQLEHGVKVARGVAQPTAGLLLTQEKAQGKSKSYAAIKFSAYYEGQQ